MKRLFAILIALLGASAARAQSTGGFTLERFEPTPAGQWSFWVDHPWYTRSKYFAAVGLTLDYSHDPLKFYMTDSSGTTSTNEVVRHQLVAHIDAAVSFLDRFSIAASMPIVLLERGTAELGIGPIGGGAAGDPRIGGMVRLWHRPLEDALSVNLGFDLWIPIGAASNHAGDTSVRLLPKVVLAGLTHRILWSFLFGFQYRPDATVGMLPAGSGNTVGSELKFGAAVAYADLPRRFSVGPELVASTVATGAFSFQRNTSSLELLVGGHYNVIGQIDTGLALGVGLLTEPGTPDFRLIVRIAYSPMRPDRKAPPVVEQAPPSPPPQAEPPPPPPAPPPDRDHDGVLDSDDECPDLAAGPHPSATRRGCPDTDKDGDGVFDSADQCPDVAAGLHPDPARLGCPLPDRDNDTVPDSDDACPDKPGAPSPDPKKNGCPGLVEIKNGQMVIMKPVFFATDKDVILPRSFPVLQAVADALTAQPEIKRVSIEGHTDNRGKPEHNLELSQRRAQSVMQFLVEHGLAPERLEAHGFGHEQPIDSNRTNAGRAANRRVEFRIVGSPSAAPVE
ncbi:MAG: outer membrane protein [bacterium]|nr:outer membrane protein [bacterium]